MRPVLLKMHDQMPSDKQCYHSVTEPSNNTEDHLLLKQLSKGPPKPTMHTVICKRAAYMQYVFH